VLPVDNKMLQNYEAIKTAITLEPGVISITGAYEAPTFVEWSDVIRAETGAAKKNISVNATPVDLDYVKTMGMDIIAGTDFTKADLQLLDTADNYKITGFLLYLMKAQLKSWDGHLNRRLAKPLRKVAGYY
jgi:putative ABC transport system permease protein